MDNTLLPQDLDTLLRLYRQVKSYHPYSKESFIAIKNHANILKLNLEKVLKGPINMADYECWYEIQSDKELNSQVPYLKYKDDSIYV